MIGLCDEPFSLTMSDYFGLFVNPINWPLKRERGRRAAASHRRSVCILMERVEYVSATRRGLKTQ